MGFLDKAKNKLSGLYNSVSEETVRKIDYEVDDEIFDEPEAEPKQKPKPKVKADKPVVDIKSKLSSIVKTDKPKVEKVKEEKVAPKKSKKDENPQEVKDVLEVLNILETFKIPPNVLMPEDLEQVKFDLQVPKGYDIGQVNAFLEQVITTTKHYVTLLKTRNSDVAKLATTIDRLEVDLNNIKFDSELSQGINIMPSDSDDNVINENIELKLENRRLKELLENKNFDEELSEEKQNEFHALQDKLSLANRRVEDLNEEIYGLRNRIAYFEEQADATMEKVSDYTEVEVDDSEWDVDNSVNNIPSFSETFGQGLESIALDDEDLDLPEVDLNESRHSNNESDAYEDFYNESDSNNAFATVNSDPVQDLFNATPIDFDEKDDEGAFSFDSDNSSKMNELYKSEHSNTDFLSDIISNTWEEKESGK